MWLISESFSSHYFCSFEPFVIAHSASVQLMDRCKLTEFHRTKIALQTVPANQTQNQVGWTHNTHDLVKVKLIIINEDGNFCILIFSSNIPKLSWNFHALQNENILKRHNKHKINQVLEDLHDESKCKKINAMKQKWKVKSFLCCMRFWAKNL